jgi:tetratricopeptide (TPR) repeat protein
VAAAKKKTRKELLKEPDEFLSVSSRMIALLVQHKAAIVYAVGGLLAAAALFSGYTAYSGLQETRASERLAEAVAKYDRLAARGTPAAAAQEVAGDFEKIVGDYGNRVNGNMARLVYANVCYRAGDFKKAVELYRACLPRFEDHPLFHLQVLKGLGYAFEGLKDDAAAVGYFEQALAASETSLKDDVLFHLGNLYARLGKPEKSTQAFKRILDEYKDSVYANLVRERVDG